MGTIVKENDGRFRVRIRRKVRGVLIDKSARFDRLTDARRWDRETETEIHAGKFFKTLTAGQHTVGEVISRYRAHLSLDNPRRLKTVANHLLWWDEQLGQSRLADLNPAMIASSLNKLRQQVVPNRKGNSRYTSATVNRYKSVLQTALGMAVRQWCWLEENPAQKIKNFTEPEGRDRFLSEEEIAQLLECCKASENADLYAIVVLALSSGARREEVRTIKWSDVLLEHEKIILRKTKNKKTRTIHLTHAALTEIRQRAAKRTEVDVYLFPSPTDHQKPMDFRRAWRTALKRSKIPNFRFHDLRHTAASYLAMSGATPSELAEVLGHQSLAMVKRYAHLCDSHTTQVVKRMNESIFNVKATSVGQ